MSQIQRTSIKNVHGIKSAIVMSYFGLAQYKCSLSRILGNVLTSLLSSCLDSSKVEKLSAVPALSLLHITTDAESQTVAYQVINDVLKHGNNIN